jgi:hypothetical protein
MRLFWGGVTVGRVFTSFIAKVKRGVPLRQLGDHSTNRFRVGVDLAKKTHLPVAAAFGDRHSVTYLRHVQSNENLRMLLHGSSSCGEDRLATCEQPSLTRTV